MGIGRVQPRGQIMLSREIRRAANIEPGDTVSRHVLAEGKVEINVLPRLQLAEALERYRIDGPVDVAADRLLWQETAAADVHGRSDG
jgi:bifunctional DNA-binding transcriptional regulator/antitoxin component of YhaV-PrlF toxin-antitoxin module